MRHTRLSKKHIIVFLFFTLLLSSAVQSFAGSAPKLEETTQANTLFIPFKINSSADTAELTSQTDQALAAAVATEHQVMFSRDKAKKQMSYGADWPPQFSQLEKIDSAHNFQYIVTGSLTRLGSNISIDLVAYDLLDSTTTRTFFKETALANLTGAVAELVNQVAAYTGRNFRIAEIKISGNTRIDSGAILLHITKRSGDIYNHRQLRDDLKNIFKMGYFNDVQISVKDTEAGKRITYIVKEKEVISSVTITGEKAVETDDIKEVLTVSPNTIVSQKAIRESEENIRKLYKEKGFYDTEITAHLTYPKEERVNIRFDIVEGSKIYVKKITFNGNKSFSDKEFEKILVTSTKDWLSWFTESGLLKRDMVKQDASRIAAFYQNNGFIDAKVGEPEIEKHGEWLYVTFNISEGNRYKVGLIDIKGDLIEDRQVLEGMTTIGNEKYFNRKILRDDVMRITDYYAANGYAYAEVDPQVTKNTEEKRVSLSINIRKGELVHVNRIIIKGNSRTRDKVIRRAMAIDEQSIFDATALKKSTERLQRLDYFEDINITPEPAYDADNLMDVIVELKEKSTGTFSIGAGFSSVDGLILMGDITQHNFLGRGQSLTLQGNIGGDNTRYNVSFTEPHLNDSKLSFGFDVYHWTRDFDDYDKESNGVALRLGYPIWRRWRLYGSWGYDDSNMTEVSEDASQIILDSVDINITHFFSLSLSRDTRNRNFNPNKGSQNTISVKKAGGLLGGDAAYTKYEALTSWYFGWRWNTVFHVKASAGYITEDDSGKLPVYEKFYLGGLNSMRGFESGEISPVDPVTDEKIGGEKMAYMNLEYIFPLVEDMGLNGLVFYDMGFVNETDQDWEFDDIRSSVGFGFRWLSPMGPLRLEWGYNIDPLDSEDQSLWDFSIGGSF